MTPSLPALQSRHTRLEAVKGELASLFVSCDYGHFKRGHNLTRAVFGRNAASPESLEAKMALKIEEDMPRVVIECIKTIAALTLAGQRYHIAHKMMLLNPDERISARNMHAQWQYTENQRASHIEFLDAAIPIIARGDADMRDAMLHDLNNAMNAQAPEFTYKDGAPRLKDAKEFARTLGETQGYLAIAYQNCADAMTRMTRLNFAYVCGIDKTDKPLAQKHWQEIKTLIQHHLACTEDLLDSAKHQITMAHNSRAPWTQTVSPA